MRLLKISYLLVWSSHPRFWVLSSCIDYICGLISLWGLELQRYYTQQMMMVSLSQLSTWRQIHLKTTLSLCSLSFKQQKITYLELTLIKLYHETTLILSKMRKPSFSNLQEVKENDTCRQIKIENFAMRARTLFVLDLEKVRVLLQSTWIQLFKKASRLIAQLLEAQN